MSNKVYAHVVAQAPDGTIWAAFAQRHRDISLSMTKREALDLAKMLVSAAESDNRIVLCGNNAD